MSPSDLLELAARCERASGDDLNLFREAGAAAFNWTGDTDNIPDAMRRFDKWLSEGAFVNAAMTLVPEGCCHGYRWSAKHKTARATVEYIPEAPFAPADLISVESRKCATPALALTAASLRARAAGLVTEDNRDG